MLKALRVGEREDKGKVHGVIRYEFVFGADLGSSSKY